MPSVDDGNRAVKSSAELAADQAETNRIIKKYSGGTSAGTGSLANAASHYTATNLSLPASGGGSNSSSNSNTVTSATGANYPNGYETGDSSSMEGMIAALIGALSPLPIGNAAALWNQTKFGMNDAVKVHYDKLLEGGIPEGKTVQDMVNAAREMYHVDNDKKGTPTRGDENADINSTGATHTVSEDGTVVEDTPETVAAEMGKLGLTNIKGPDGRPTWAPALPTEGGAVDPYAPKDPNAPYVNPNAVVRDAYGIKMDQDFLGMEEWQRREDIKNAAPTDPYAPPALDPNAVDPYAPSALDPNAARASYAPPLAGAVGTDGMLLGATGATGATTGANAVTGAGAQNAMAGAAQGASAAQGAGAGAAQGAGAGAAQGASAAQGMLTAPTPYVSQGMGDIYQPQGTPEAYQSQGMGDAYQAPNTAPAPTGATIPTGPQEAGTFRPVTFRSGTGTSTTDSDGTTTSLSDPYSSLSGLVGAGQGLLTQAAGNAQQAPDQLNFNMNTDQQAADLFAQRSALLDPAFAQQRALAKQDMFGSGRLGLRLSGEAVGAGAGSGMVQPDAFGMNQAQSQALAGIAAQSTDDAFARAQAVAGLDSQRFTQNQQAQQQQYANLTNSGQGMLSAGLQGAQLEAGIAQQQSANQQASQAQQLSQARLALDTQAQAQNFGLASQGQAQDYGLSRDQFGLASQGQAQNFGLARDQFGLAQQTQDQSNYMNNQRLALDTLANSQLDARGNRGMDINLRGQDQQNAINQGRLALDTTGQTQNYGLAQQQQRQDYGLANRGQDLQQQQQFQNYGLSSRGLDQSGQQMRQDYGLGQQQFNLAQQQQFSDYGLNSRRLDQAGQQQLQDYEMGMLTGNRNYNLTRDVAAQDYELDTERNRINLITGQARANKDNYQPNDLLNLLGGGLNAYAGTKGGSASIGGLIGKLFGVK